ncbi:hypothetical protein BH10ACI1_BH10ACI1_20700 [soil metagenome]
MNKQQTIWLIIRLIGVYFGYWAIVSLLTFVASFYTFVSLPSATAAAKQNTNSNIPGIPISTPRVVNPTVETPKTEAEKVSEKAKSDALKDVFWYLFLTAIYGAIGWYLIKNGKYIFALLIREEQFELFAETAESSTFPVSPKSSEMVTSLNIPSRKEEVTSLNLSEYVPKSQQTKPPDVQAEQNSLPVQETAETVAPIEIKPESEVPAFGLINPQTDTSDSITEPETVENAPFESPEVSVSQIEQKPTNDLAEMPYPSNIVSSDEHQS